MSTVVPPTVSLTDALAWLVVGVFLVGQVLSVADYEVTANRLTGVAWGLFGVFWLVLVPTFLVDMGSFVEGILSLLAVPACLYTGSLVWRGRGEVMVLSRSLAVMGVLYLSATTVPGIRRWLVETVAAQTDTVIRALGYDVVLRRSDVHGFESEFVFTDASGHRYVTYIVLACTGIGTMAVVAGIVAAAAAPLRRKAVALLVGTAIIWTLNVVRNVFIAVAFGDQWFQSGVAVAASQAAGFADPALASYFVADRVISQTASVVAVVGVFVVVLRLLPESSTVFEAALYVVTGREYDLRAELGL